MTFAQETERVYSYNPGARMGHMDKHMTAYSILLILYKLTWKRTLWIYHKFRDVHITNITVKILHYITFDIG